MTATIPADAQPLALVRVSDGQGGFRHELRPVPPETPKVRGRKRHVPDPIEAGAGNGAEQLKLFIERLERLEEEKASILDDIKDVRAEAKAIGFDVKAIAAIVALRKIQPDLRREAEMILETYKASLGIE